jgi:hypothetical protein
MSANMGIKKYPDIRDSSFKGVIGVAQIDVTPPVGIYSRNWGAAKSDTALGIHHPLMLSVITFQSAKNEKPLVLIAADFGIWGNVEDGELLRNEILRAMSLDRSQLMFCLSHTHAGPSLSLDDSSKTGGEYIESYLLDLKCSAVSASRAALLAAVPAVLTWHYGTCKLSANRDLPDVNNDRYVVGFNPEKKCDDTLLVGRITDEQGSVISSIVNYACHPTTLAWDNQLISPDFVGAMRELVQSATKAPCVFLQGASGDLAPVQQYTGDTEIADKNGRQLGYCVMATLESMFAPEMEFSFSSVVESGAPLAVWEQKMFQPSTQVLCEIAEVEYDLQSLPPLVEIQRQYQECNDRVLKERLWRKRSIRLNIGEGDSVIMPLWIWKLGDSFLIGQPNEAYSEFQQTIRHKLFPASVAVINLVNGSAGYLPPKECYEHNMYQVWQTPFAVGSLEKLTNISLQTIEKMILKSNYPNHESSSDTT